MKQKPKSCKQRSKQSRNKQKLLDYQEYLKNLRNFNIDIKAEKKQDSKNQQIPIQTKKNQINNNIRQQVNKKYQAQIQIGHFYSYDRISQKRQRILNKQNVKQKQSQTYNFDDLLCLDQNIQSLMSHKEVAVSDKERNYLHNLTHRTSKFTQLTMPSIQQRIASQENQQKQNLVHTHKKYNSLNSKKRIDSQLMLFNATNATEFHQSCKKNILVRSKCKKTNQFNHKSSNKSKNNCQNVQNTFHKVQFIAKNAKIKPFNIQTIMSNTQTIFETRQNTNAQKIKINVKQVLDGFRTERNSSTMSNKSYQNKKIRIRNN